MEILETLLFSLSLCLPVVMEMRRAADASSIKSLQGLGISLAASVIQIALVLGGLFLGKALHFEPAEMCGTIALALLVVVAVKMFITSLSKKERPGYDLSKTATVLALCVALAINTFITGIALGMSTDNMKTTTITAAVSVAVFGLLFSEIGVMLGRQKKTIREKRHWIVALLLYLAAIAWHVAF